MRYLCEHLLKLIHEQYHVIKGTYMLEHHKDRKASTLNHQCNRKKRTLPNVKDNAEIDVIKGKILGSTKWKAWRCVYKEKNFIRKKFKIIKLRYQKLTIKIKIKSSWIRTNNKMYQNIPLTFSYTPYKTRNNRLKL